MTSLQPIQPQRPLYWPAIIEKLAEKLTYSDLYLVGGTVRDVYLRRPVHDLDFTTPEDGRPIARHIANLFDGDYYPMDDERGVGRAFIEYDGQTWIVDVARFRGETLADDLNDRDFTANAIAVNMNDLTSVIDPLDGLTALEQKFIQVCHAQSIAHDPVRALRAIRQSVTHKMKLTPTTIQAIKQDGMNFTQTSPERVRDEFFKLLNVKGVSGALLTLDMLGLLSVLLPEINDLKGLEQSPPHRFDVWRHTLKVIDHLDKIITTISPERTDNTASNLSMGMIALALSKIRLNLQKHLDKTGPNKRPHRALLILAALAHDIGKPATMTVGDNGRIHNYQHEMVGTDIAQDWAERLRLSNDEAKILTTIVRHHMRPHHLHTAGKVSKRAEYRFWRDTDAIGVDICLLAMADYLGKAEAIADQDAWIAYTDMIQLLLEGYFLEPEELVTFTPVIDGNDIQQQFKLAPGPMIGEMLSAVHEAQAIGEVTTREEAIEWLTDWLDDNISGM